MEDLKTYVPEDWEKYVSKNKKEIVFYDAEDIGSALYYAKKYIGTKAKVWKLSKDIIGKLYEIGISTDLIRNNELYGNQVVIVDIYTINSNEIYSLADKILNILKETFAQTPIIKN